jgi:uncharacterized protein YjdB
VARDVLQTSTAQEVPMLLSFARSTLSIAALGVAVAACASTSSSSSSTVSAIAVSPSPCTVGRTDSRQLTALATLPDGTKQDITSNEATQWSSANPQTATVNAAGVVVGVNAGITRITANYMGASGSVECTVGP